MKNREELLKVVKLIHFNTFNAKELKVFNGKNKATYIKTILSSVKNICPIIADDKFNAAINSINEQIFLHMNDCPESTKFLLGLIEEWAIDFEENLEEDKLIRYREVLYNCVVLLETLKSFYSNPAVCEYSFNAFATAYCDKCPTYSKPISTGKVTGKPLTAMVSLLKTLENYHLKAPESSALLIRVKGMCV